MKSHPHPACSGPVMPVSPFFTTHPHIFAVTPNSVPVPPTHALHPGTRLSLPASSERPCLALCAGEDASHWQAGVCMCVLWGGTSKEALTPVSPPTVLVPTTSHLQEANVSLADQDKCKRFYIPPPGTPLDQVVTVHEDMICSGGFWDDKTICPVSEADRDQPSSVPCCVCPLDTAPALTSTSSAQPEDTSRQLPYITRVHANSLLCLYTGC